jgi:DNA repair exonuclease SbcCD ATPase subunit
VEFVPGINLLIGSTNAGKTAVLRGIKWILKNRPLGGNFIPRGGKEAYVDTVWEMDGKELEVSRRRNKSETVNSYTMTGFEEPFTSFSTKPPPDVVEAINLSDINMQYQFSPYFLVFDTPGAVAEYIRAITGLVDIDKVADEIGTQIRKNTLKVGEKEETLKELEAQLHVLNEIPLAEFEEQLEQAKELLQAKEKGEEICGAINSLCSQIIELQEQQLSIPDQEVVELNKDIKATVDRYKENVRQLKELESLVSSWEELNSQRLDVPSEEVSKIDQQVQSVGARHKENVQTQSQLIDSIETWRLLEEEKLDLPSDELQKVETFILKHEELCGKLLSLYDFIREAQEEEKAVNEIRIELGILRDEENALLSQLDSCHYCGSKLTEKSKRKLLEHH